MRRVLLVLALALLGCPPVSDKSSGATTTTMTTCTKFGDSCEFSPGKLGSCVHKDDCVPSSPGETCLVCQSQH